VHFVFKKGIITNLKLTVMKRLLIILPLVLCFITSCQDKAAKAELEAFKAQKDLEMKNKEIVKRWLSEVDKQNYDIVDELITEDFRAYYAKDTLGRETLRASVESIPISFSESVHIIDDLFAEKDKVIARMTVKDIHTGEFMGTAPTGKHVEYTAINIYRLEDGMIKEMWWDNNAVLGLILQLGMELQMWKAGE